MAWIKVSLRSKVKFIYFNKYINNILWPLIIGLGQSRNKVVSVEAEAGEYDN